MLKGVSGIMQIMKQAQSLQGRMGEIQQRLAELEVEGTAGAGMVTVTANGQQQITGCRIEQSVFEAGDREMLEDLVVSAANQAIDRAKAAAAEQMGGLVEGLDMPGLEDALSRFGITGGQA